MSGEDKAFLIYWGMLLLALVLVIGMVTLAEVLT